MAFIHSPKIVTDGLVLALDAANTKSYVSGSTSWNNLTNTAPLSGSLINGPTYSSANLGSIVCDGINDYIEVLDNAALDFGSGSFTVEYWFRKLETTSVFDNIWGPNKWNSGAAPGTNEWILIIGNGTTGTGNQYGFAVESGSVGYGISETTTTQLSLNTWYQLVGQRDGANFKTYLNGALTMNVTSSGFTTSSVINNVGRNLRINNSAVNNLYTKADNANLKIYNRALSAAEVQKNYNALKGRFGL